MSQLLMSQQDLFLMKILTLRQDYGGKANFRAFFPNNYHIFNFIFKLT